SPESYIGGPLALVRTGDMISLDVDKRTIDMNVSDEELARRRAAWRKPEARYERGYGWMFTRHIKQANEGCDFDFLQTGFGVAVAADPAEPANRTLTVQGAGGRIPNAGTAGQPIELFVENAGTAARFLPPMLCLGHGSYRVSGIARMHQRPQAALVHALR